MSKRTEKGSNKKWVDRIDVISAHAGSKHVSQTSFPVNTFEDVITRQVVALPRFVFCIVFCIVIWVVTHDCSISLFSEQLHECLGMPDPASVLFRLELEHNIFFRDEAR
jgi:ABC-type proline/glycine betaine transport system permease subunit